MQRSNISRTLDVSGLDRCLRFPHPRLVGCPEVSRESLDTNIGSILAPSITSMFNITTPLGIADFVRTQPISLTGHPLFIALWAPRFFHSPELEARMFLNSRYTLAASLAVCIGSPSYAVEGGLGAYLLGSRDSFAGIVPEPGTYAGLDIVQSGGSVQGLSLAGLPIREDSDLKLSFAKLSVTEVFDAQLWGGTPAVNINIPFVLDANLTFIGQTPPCQACRFPTRPLGEVTLPRQHWWDGTAACCITALLFQYLHLRAGIVRPQ
jgi:hypothetical protein